TRLWHVSESSLTPAVRGGRGLSGLCGRLRWLLRDGGGQLDDERRPLAECRFDPDLSVHAPDELAADVEAEAGAADAASHVRVEPIELLEDPPVLRGWDPEAFVDDREADQSVAVRHRHR